MRLVVCSTTFGGPPAGSGTVVFTVSTSSFSGQSTSVTFEQNSSRNVASSRRNNAISRACSGSTSSECCAAGPGFVTTETDAPGNGASRRSRTCSTDSMLDATSLFLPNDRRWLPDSRVLRWVEVAFAEVGNGVFAAIICPQVARGFRPGEMLAANFLLQCDESIQQRLGAGRTAGDVDIHRYEPVDPLEHIVALFEGSAGNRTRAHRDAILGLGHLIPQSHDLRCHLFGDGAGNDKQIRLARRRPKHFGAETRDVEARHRGRDHFDRATREAKLQGPHRVAPTPVVEVLHFCQENAVASEFLALMVRNHRNRRRAGIEWRGGCGCVAHVISTRGDHAATPRPDPRPATR